MSAPGGKLLVHVLGSDAIGGVEVACINIARHLAQEKIAQAAVFFGDYDGSGPTSQKFKALGIVTYGCRLERGGRLKFMRAFWRLCRELSPQTILCHTFGVHVFVAIAARLAGVRKFFVLAGNPPPSDLRARLGSAVFAHIAEPFVTREIANSNYVAREMKRKYVMPFRNIVPSWCLIDTDDIRRRAEAARARQEARPFTVGMVARLDPIKDHPTVLRAMALFLAKRSDAQLVIVGDGSERSRLETMADELGIRDRVSFLGTRSDIPEILATFDVFIYGATRDEGFGIVLAEAMAAGVPVLATDVGPCREVLADGQAGLLVPPADAQALAQALAKLAASPELRHSLATAAVAAAGSRYSFKNGGKRWIDLLAT